MPPKNVRTIRQLIYWEYAKRIAGSAVDDRRIYGFVMHTFKRLESGRLAPSAILRENKQLVEGEKACAYCGARETLQWEHIIPKSRGGAETIDNLVLACAACNQSKGDRDPFEWYGRERRYEVPRLVLGKYLKLVFEAHERAGTLDRGDLNADGKLDVLDRAAVLARGLLLTPGRNEAPARRLARRAVGGGAGNRTRVPRRSERASTCVSVRLASSLRRRDGTADPEFAGCAYRPPTRRSGGGQPVIGCGSGASRAGRHLCQAACLGGQSVVAVGN